MPRSFQSTLTDHGPGPGLAVRPGREDRAAAAGLHTPPATRRSRLCEAVHKPEPPASYAPRSVICDTVCERIFVISTTRAGVRKRNGGRGRHGKLSNDHMRSYRSASPQVTAASPYQYLPTEAKLATVRGRVIEEPADALPGRPERGADPRERVHERRANDRPRDRL